MPSIAVTFSEPIRQGDFVSPKLLKSFLAFFPKLVRRVIRMTIEGRSTAKTRPQWLVERAKLHIRGVSINATGLCEVQLVQDRPAEAQELPNALTELVSDLALMNFDSTTFDRPLLATVIEFEKWLRPRCSERALFNDIDETAPSLISIQFDGAARAIEVNRQLVENAIHLNKAMPKPRRVRVEGVLTRFNQELARGELVLDTGEGIPLLHVRNPVEAAMPSLGQRVAVFGRAIYRPSGNLLRLDAESMQVCPVANSVFSRIPRPNRTNQDTAKIFPQVPKRGRFADVIGQWPGDESDEEIARALQELS